jgi:hypothetical protein
VPALPSRVVVPRRSARHSDPPALNGQAAGNARHARDGVEHHFVGHRHRRPDRERALVRVEREVAEVEGVRHLGPGAPAQRDHAALVDEDPIGIKELSAAQVHRLERRHPDGSGKRRTFGGALIPGLVGQSGIAPPRDHVYVQVHGLLDVVQLGHVQKVDGEPHESGRSCRVGPRERIRTAVGTCHTRPWRDGSFQVQDHVGRGLLRVRRP